jgi:prophage maintenance system killer protein
MTMTLWILDRRKSLSELAGAFPKNHALVDGNRRLAWFRTVVLCDLNRTAPNLTDDQAFQLVWDIAASTMGLATIAERLQLSPLT